MPARMRSIYLRATVTPMAMESVAPWTNVLRLDESSSLRRHRYADRFSIVRVETTGPLPDAVHKSSNVPALLVSTFVRPVAAPDYRLWVDGKIVPTGPIPAFGVNVVDLAAEPAMWGGRGVDYVPEPKAPGANEVLVAIEYSPVNPSDLLVARGAYPLRPELPSVIGNEGVGRVLMVGPGVTNLAVGDRVVPPRSSWVWRERMIIPAGGLFALPREADPSKRSRRPEERFRAQCSDRWRGRSLRYRRHGFEQLWVSRARRASRRGRVSDGARLWKHALRCLPRQHALHHGVHCRRRRARSCWPRIR